MSDVFADPTATALPIVLRVKREITGGITGLSPVLSIRDVQNTSKFLDFTDHTFKTSGWTTKTTTLTDVGEGFYVGSLNVAQWLPAVSSGQYYLLEYHVDNGAGISGDAHDTLLVTTHDADLKLFRAWLLNRTESLPGNPGTLNLYADDGVTILHSWHLTDYNGGSVSGTAGVPAKRAAASP